MVEVVDSTTQNVKCEMYFRVEYVLHLHGSTIQEYTIYIFVFVYQHNYHIRVVRTAVISIE